MQRDPAPLTPDPGSPEAAPARMPVLLAVDDEPANLRLIGDLFSGELQVLVATRGEQALALCASALPDLILLDVVMPGLDGHAVCKQLKANPVTRDIPVIFVTSNSDPEAETHALGLGGADFISKPINASVVRARVNSQLMLVSQRSELKRTIESLRLSQAEAVAANTATHDYLSVVAHELRTPLTSIVGFSELLERNLGDTRMKEAAGSILKAAGHLNQLLTEILDMAKLEAGAMAIEQEPLSLRQVVADTRALFLITAQDKGLELNATVADSVPAIVQLDGMRIRQILNNLLSNAFKFTSQGSVSIAVSGDASAVVLHVSDTGPGIAAQLHASIFERFKQAGPGGSRRHGGTGLGLSLSRGLAERMGGSLHVVSAPGQGAKFIVTLPLGAHHASD